MSIQTSILNDKIRDLDLSVTFCAALLGGAPNLNAELSGLRPMPNDRFLTLNKKLDVIADIADRVKPLRLNFKDAAQVREWIRLHESGDLKLPTADAIPEKDQIEYNVKFGGHYFAGQNSSGRDVGHPSREKAVNLSHAEAVEIGKRLFRMGFKDAAVVEVPSTISSTE